MLTACFCSGLFEQRWLAFGLLVKWLGCLLCLDVLCMVFRVQCCYVVTHIGHNRFVVLVCAFSCYFFLPLLVFPLLLEISPLSVLPQFGKLVFFPYFLHPRDFAFVQLP